MPSPTSVKDALNQTAPVAPILVQGWVRTRRDSKDFSFIELNDGSSLAESADHRQEHPAELCRSAAVDHWRFHYRARGAGRVTGQGTKLGSSRG